MIGRTIFFTSDKNRPTNQKPAITHRDEIYFIDFWRENLSMYRIIEITQATRRFTDKLADLLQLDYCTSNHLEKKNNSTSLLENQLEILTRKSNSKILTRKLVFLA